MQPGAAASVTTACGTPVVAADAQVLEPGTIAVGDTVTLLTGR